MKDKKWSREEMNFLYQSRIERKPYRLIAHELGRTEKSCECKYRETDWLKEGIADTDAEEDYFQRFSEFTQKQVNYLDKRHNLFKMRADVIADSIERAIQSLPKVDKPLYKPTKEQKKHSPQDVGLLLSDLHVGQQHTLEETGGISEYNLDIFVRRLENLKKAIVEITERHRVDTVIENLHIFCLGDLVAGLNAAGGWSHLYISTPMYKQMAIAADALASLIYFLTPLYQNIYFYGIGGNHGRAAPMGEQKDVDNWDTVAYRFIAKELKQNDRVHFKIPETWWTLETIRNHKYLLVHGDHTKGGALRGLENFGNKMIGVIGQFDYLLAGHFHNTAEMTTNGFKIKLNGCFLSDTQVQLANGRRVNIADVKQGDLVVGEKLLPSPVTGKKESHYKGPIYGMRFSGNTSPIYCTPNHQFLACKASLTVDRPLKASEGNQYLPIKNTLKDVRHRYIPAEYLNVGDYVVIATDKRGDSHSYLSFYGRTIEVTSAIARMLGLYLAEGSSSGAAGRLYHSDWTFHIRENHLADYVKDGLLPFDLNVYENERPNKTTRSVVVNNTKFAQWIVELCGKGAANKHIPDAWFNWSSELKMSLLSGYLMGDGHPAKLNKNGGTNFMVASTSRTLRDQMCYIAKSLGLHGKVQQKTSSRENWSDSYWLIFSGEDAVLIANECGRPFEHAFSKSTDRNIMSIGNYNSVKIMQIWTEYYDGNVFDLEVLDQSSFNVEGVVCHNSFVGSDVYSLRNVHAFSKPEQKIFGMHDFQGVTWNYDLNLDVPRG